MALSGEQMKEYTRRLLLSRMRILCDHGFYGLLLMHMRYGVDQGVETACTDGTRIVFGTGFLDRLSDRELDFVMMHEILHVALRHCFRQGDRDPYPFNVACDIVVNSNILKENGMDLQSITLKDYGPSMHLAPDQKEGYEYTAEEVYAMLPSSLGDPQGKGKAGQGDKGGCQQSKKGKGSGNGQGDQTKGEEPGLWDDHSRWEQAAQTQELSDLWVQRTLDAAEAISIRDPSNARGLLPGFARRLVEELKAPQTDWRTVLNDFVQEDVVDYSFSPPDRRFDDSPFFLPDFNQKDHRVENILFMVDTSASMSDKMISAAYSEIKGAIDQFDGKLRGWLGFFDAAVVEPAPFSDEEEFKAIRPAGGGGTNFQIIFQYVKKYMADPLPASIIIFTDGYAPFPKEQEAMDIPVLWLLNNQEVKPPWGRVARIRV